MSSEKLAMSNEKKGAIFHQSLRDFPCTVVLGKNAPSFGLHRFKQALRFIPFDDEGFTLRGDRRRLLYKGRRRSHRFTILGDNSFECDCILLREPESNTISLRMEGAENFDFFRQPDFLNEPLLAGSYAVYKKDTLLGEGTGKLCHIHRPEIIDARGRRCWGDLSIIGNELRITIPGKWLGEAAYPVIVDPTVGTTTVGSQYKWDADPPEPWVQLMFEGSIPVNRFLVPEAINGLCTAYMYSYVDNYDEAGGRPVLYSDNGNSPLTRKSMNEGFADLTVKSGKPAGWRSASFSSNGAISSGSYIWFGVFADFFWEPRFDYGAKCYIGDWYDIGNSIPNTYPLYNVNWFSDFKLSMYFTYTSAQNYLRTLTQGVTLTDSRKVKADYKRGLSQTAGVNSLLGRYKTFFLKLHEMAKNADKITSPVLILRSLQETVKMTDTISHLGAFYRGLSDIAEVDGEVKIGWILLAKIVDSVHAVSSVFRGLTLFVRIVTGVFVRDYLLRRFLIAREELILKSAVCREIVLESKIN
jgi:hypothetical protein